jgi:glucokinase
MSAPVVVGIDLGGTYVRVGVFRPQGQLLHTRQQAIEAHLGGEAGVQRILTLVEQAYQESGGELIGIGMGSTGPLDSSLGLIQNPYTLPGWENVPILQPLRDHFGVPAVLENDADVAALGEYWAGAGGGVQRLYAVTVGTGIGTALIYHGQIYRGLGGNHPEGGHQVIDPSGPLCYCGATGCWEALAAAPAIAARAQAAAQEQPNTLLLQLAGGDLSRIDAKLVAAAARQGDSLALKIFSATARYIGLGILNCIAMFLPETIVLSGGVMKSADLLLPQIQSLVAQHAAMHPVHQVRLVKAKLGYHAGLYGAAYAILQSLEEVK